MSDGESVESGWLVLQSLTNVDGSVTDDTACSSYVNLPAPSFVLADSLVAVLQLPWVEPDSVSRSTSWRNRLADGPDFEGRKGTRATDSQTEDRRGKIPNRKWSGAEAKATGVEFTRTSFA